jgi:hypothetical protein
MSFDLCVHEREVAELEQRLAAAEARAVRAEGQVVELRHALSARKWCGHCCPPCPIVGRGCHDYSCTSPGNKNTCRGCGARWNGDNWMAAAHPPAAPLPPSGSEILAVLGCAACGCLLEKHTPECTDCGCWGFFRVGAKRCDNPRCEGTACASETAHHGHGPNVAAPLPGEPAATPCPGYPTWEKPEYAIHCAGCSHPNAKPPTTPKEGT